MSKNKNQVCPICNNHCPLDDLKCGKGRKYLQSLESPTESTTELEVNPRQEELLILLDQCGHFLSHSKGGKRGQGKILKILSNNPEMTQKELQDNLAIQSGSMSEIIKKLERKGLISSTKSESDKRENILKITDEGINIFLENGKNNFQKGPRLFDVLEDEEQDELKRLLSKLSMSWEACSCENLDGRRNRNKHPEGRHRERHHGEHRGDHHGDHRGD